MNRYRKSETSILSGVTALLCCIAWLMIAEPVIADPSQTLVVENNTDATVYVNYSHNVRVQEKHEVMIPPQTEKTLKDYLPFGVIEVFFDARCVEPSVGVLKQQIQVNQTSTQVKRKRLVPGDFGRSVMFDRPGCGAPDCDDLSGNWAQVSDNTGGSTWILDKNGHAEETGLGDASGTWSYDGTFLMIEWWLGDQKNPSMSGSYRWDLDSKCTKGKGNLKFDTGFRAGETVSSSVTRE